MDVVGACAQGRRSCLFGSNLCGERLLVGKPSALATLALSRLSFKFRAEALGSHLPTVASTRCTGHMVSGPVVVHCRIGMIRDRNKWSVSVHFMMDVLAFRYSRLETS
jgi:hypothetical protein